MHTVWINSEKSKDWGGKLYFQTFAKLKMFEEILKNKTSWSFTQMSIINSYGAEIYREWENLQDNPGA